MITLGLQGAGAEFRGFPLTKEKQTAIRGVLKRKAGGYLNYTTSPGRGEGIVNRLLNQQARVQSKTKTACWMPKELLFAMRERGEFAEWAEVHGNFYGTSRHWLEQRMGEGGDMCCKSYVIPSTAIAIQVQDQSGEAKTVARICRA
jgi:hypothetical protein